MVSMRQLRLGSIAFLGVVSVLTSFCVTRRLNSGPKYSLQPDIDGQFATQGVDCGLKSKYVVVTFVHDDEKYIDSANRLALSLDEYGEGVERVAMTINEVDGLRGWKQCRFKAVNNNAKELVPAWDNVLTKLEVLRLKGRITKVVYVDADCLAGPRVLELFGLDVSRDTIAAHREYEDLNYKESMNSGVMVFVPSPSLFYMAADVEINRTSSDQDAIQTAIDFGRIKWKPLEIGLVMSRAELNIREGLPYGVCHWAGFDKPWTGCAGKNDSMCSPWNRYGTILRGGDGKRTREGFWVLLDPPNGLQNEYLHYCCNRNEKDEGQ